MTKTAALALLAAGLFARSACAEDQLEERKLPMHFTWNTPAEKASCGVSCRGWTSATGVIVAETSKAFDEFAKGRDLEGTAMVLDSSGGSVVDAIALGTRLRAMAVSTTVGSTVRTEAGSDRAIVMPDAYCESMCVFLLLSGKERYVPVEAHVRVHEIWMGDRAESPKESTYSAEDLMIVQRDIGKLAKFTFDMGGTGDLLEIALEVPPWAPLHELSEAELRQANLNTEAALGAIFVRAERVAGPKPVQDRLVSEAPVPEAHGPEASVSAEKVSVSRSVPVATAAP